MFTVKSLQKSYSRLALGGKLQDERPEQVFYLLFAGVIEVEEEVQDRYLVACLS